MISTHVDFDRHETKRMDCQSDFRRQGSHTVDYQFFGLYGGKRVLLTIACWKGWIKARRESLNRALGYDFADEVNARIQTGQHIEP